MRKNYKLYGHEYCKARVAISFDENNRADGIVLWSYVTRVCGAYRSAQGVWKVFCTGTYTQTTRKQISWFSRPPRQSHSPWKLSYDFFRQISEKCEHGIREATDEEAFCINDLIWQYMSNGKLCSNRR